MRTGRPKAELALTDEERQTLDGLARRHETAPVLALRARIVLGCAAGRFNGDVARTLRVTPQTVGKWRSRFLARGVEGILDEPRPGAPRRITDAQVRRVVALTLGGRPQDAARWSTRSLARRVGLSPNAVGRIWHAFALYPGREDLQRAPDLLFVERVRDIVGLYLDPPDKAVALCVDGKAPIQALDRQSSPGPAQVPRRTHADLLRASHRLFAALDAAAGRMTREPHRHRSLRFREFLNAIEANAPARLDLHLVMDDPGADRVARIRRTLAGRPRWHLHFTPGGASWTHVLQRAAAELTREQVRRRAHRTTRGLEEAIRRHLRAYRIEPRPLVWTKSAGDARAVGIQFFRRIST